MQQDKQQEEKNGIKMIAFVEVDGVGVSLFQSKDKLKLTVSGSKEYISEIPLAVAEREKDIEKSIILVCARHSTWKPTEGYGSEEEKGYQKGIQVEAKLFAKDILSIITKEK